MGILENIEKILGASLKTLLDIPDDKIKDEKKLLEVAMDWGVEIGERSIQDIATEIGEKAMAE